MFDMGDPLEFSGETPLGEKSISLVGMKFN